MGYLSYWSLHQRPFTGQVGEIFFAGVPQREAIAGLNYFVASETDAAFLVAPKRVGASQLLKHVTRMHGFGDSAAEVMVTDQPLGRHEVVYRDLAEALGYRDTGDSAVCVNRAIEASATEGVKNVWLVDGCTSATADVARQLTAAHPNLKVVLGTHPDQYEKRVAEFGSIGIRIDLTPLSLEDTIDYLRYGVTQAGGAGTLFTDNAAIRLHELTGGLIADLAPLAESSLALAASHRMDGVTPAVVEAACESTSQAA